MSKIAVWRQKLCENAIYGAWIAVNKLSIDSDAIPAENADIYIKLYKNLTGPH